MDDEGWTIEIARGLQHAQQKQPGIVHQDLKPENVLIVQTRISKISDWGLAKVVQKTETRSSATPGETSAVRHVLMQLGSGIVGTPPYMAPEQWRGEPLDVRTDLIALGCILCDLLFGRPLFAPSARLVGSPQELARVTAEYLFGSERSMIRLDMSEFMEKHNVARLIGASPGYVEEGQLTGALRRTPFCVVLFDQIDKAHSEVLTLLLQLFEDGRLTDAKGRIVDGSKALYIMTSNLPVQGEKLMGIRVR